MFYLAFTIILLGQFLPEVVVANSLLEATASEILPQLISNNIRPREYVQHLIHHIKANEKRINALISFYPGRVLSSIKTTTEYQKERQCLNGLPIIVKDNIDVLGYPTTGGTPSLRNSYPKRNAPVISRLLSAGGVILGKANMHELAWSITSNNAYFGPVHNPWNLNLIPGGSSGGSAASVAARFAPIALCTDTGGSCRIPAALTVRPELQRQLRAVFQQFALDGIIFPTTRLTARLIGQDPVTLNNHTLPTLDAYVTFEDFGSTAGVPGISIPIGLTKDSKLPVGMEIEGEYGKDEKLLNVAAAVKRVFDPLPQPTDVVFKKH
ncbi:unnamed protein product [Rotaria sp. Silwood1]|nr:unnamed protein product [Rotaria sp. Silwood1]CAF3421399.1 unnamed protein product [Rotaria sp. Silwood1]CAF4619364.1 unnamed protein product [Rotaria sp. Silwood1]